MGVIRATVRGGRLETAEPVDLPDGTELDIRLPGGGDSERIGLDEEEWDNSPEGIEAWLAWYDTLEPLVITPEEVADTAAWRKAVAEYEIANRDREAGGLFP